MIRNYTSNVPASRSVQYITEKLAARGASKVQQLFDNNKRIYGIMFELDVMPDRPMTFRLPAKIDGAYEILKNRLRRPTTAAKQKCREQAERTAWRLISDWVDVQLSMIELDQAQMAEIFMPYIYNHHTGETLYEHVERGDFQHLLLLQQKKRNGSIPSTAY